jgi:hypothetical protein
MAVDWWTRGIAIYGAILSTAGGIFQFIRHRQDGARLKVAWGYYEGEPATPSSGPIDPYYSVIATNIGRQPVTLKGVRVYKQDGTFEAFSNHRFEVKTEPSEEARMTFLPPYLAQLAAGKQIRVLDTEGREWPLEKRKLKLLKEHYRQLQI